MCIEKETLSTRRGVPFWPSSGARRSHELTPGPSIAEAMHAITIENKEKGICGEEEIERIAIRSGRNYEDFLG